MPSGFHKSKNCFSIGCIFFIFIGFIAFFEQYKVTNFTCERATQINCQLTYYNEWKSSVKTYSGKEFMGVKVKGHYNERYDYYVTLLTNSGKVSDVFIYPFQSEAQKIVHKINTFISNSQETFITVTQDYSNSFNLAAAICIIFGVFGLGLTLYSYRNYI
ncbi:hypothetical protein [Nostoc punctiforme]|uniref:Uncharacterized protein n=1 Tax=Nostoc punctiforme (strain ATCC 29133 / PCC 73102) TaxID=63737 RepID=B2J1W5_NOSP7|nr:hypothetical protein [Nostoc punctiforme]ACC81967.1 hypothetical protein Npun_F3571 [Nostoc punctiforme PCC 73102]